MFHEHKEEVSTRLQSELHRLEKELHDKFQAFNNIDAKIAVQRAYLQALEEFSAYHLVTSNDDRRELASKGCSASLQSSCSVVSKPALCTAVEGGEGGEGGPCVACNTQLEDVAAGEDRDGCSSPQRTESLPRQEERASSFESLVACKDLQSDSGEEDVKDFKDFKDVKDVKAPDRQSVLRQAPLSKECDKVENQRGDSMPKGIGVGREEGAPLEGLVAKHQRCHGGGRKKKGREKDLSTCPVRHVALKIMYDGAGFHGFASQAGAERTVEAELFSALAQTRLLIGSRASSGYSRCGRTDKGVSALGQVVALRLRSKGPSTVNLKKGEGEAIESQHNGPEKVTWLNGREGPAAGCEAPMQGWVSNSLSERAEEGQTSGRGGEDDAEVAAKEDDRVARATTSRAAEASVAATADSWDEIDYVATLNRALPPDIRVLGWCPVPDGFSARFSCLAREYKYLFIPGTLNIQAMRVAASALEGEHDFRNMCKMDSANVHNYVRRIEHFRIEPLRDDEDKGVWCMHVRGTAFLWHQVRCMAAVLFMVGRREEEPSIVAELLDLRSFPRKPQFLMAPEAPLLLFACSFQGVSFRRSREATSSLQLHMQKDLDRVGIRGAMLSICAEDISASPTEVVAASAVAPPSADPSARKGVHVPLKQRAVEPSYEERQKKGLKG